MLLQTIWRRRRTFSNEGKLTQANWIISDCSVHYRIIGIAGSSCTWMIGRMLAPKDDYGICGGNSRLLPDQTSNEYTRRDDEN